MVSVPAQANSPGPKGAAFNLNTRRGERVECPRCGSDTIYRYGKTHTGKARFRCLSCDRQFIVNPRRREIKERPACPRCGGKMHLYGKGAGFARFRCASYPVCRSYLKVEEKSE
jgi:transposase-like protein